MTLERPLRHCPDCDDPIPYTFTDTAGVGAWKLGDGFNTTPDTLHYVCLPCGKAWKQRLDGPLTPDIIGNLAFFSCRHPDCGATLGVSGEPATPAGAQLLCTNGHRFVVVETEDGGLTLGAE